MNRVSVIIPMFNRADYVVGAVVSVLEQTLPAHEVIVVDDCSTDTTADTLEQFGARIQVVKPVRNGERGAARNLGAGVATGEILAFLDSDDRWSRDKLAAQSPLSALVDLPRFGGQFDLTPISWSQLSGVRRLGWSRRGSSRTPLASSSRARCDGAGCCETARCSRGSSSRARSGSSSVSG